MYLILNFKNINIFKSINSVSDEIMQIMGFIDFFIYLKKKYRSLDVFEKIYEKNKEFFCHLLNDDDCIDFCYDITEGYNHDCEKIKYFKKLINNNDFI